ncbi:transglutaminase domain-containing protein [Paenibacillus sp. YYML68]|uniref:transglutaminase domain-containing protein n=1 Tax=Paenibacillus sp. YYML68 TaxID=2909250 RepID=UPI00249374BB|nr:transglutaminase domain-containing protein [Paenibacillus sp. YYML68]
MSGTELLDAALAMNAITILIILVFAASILQGLLRGASSSAKRLALMVVEGAVTLISLFAAWQLTGWLSPLVQEALGSLDLSIPSDATEDPGRWKQLYLTAVTSFRDFSLLRYSVLFMLTYTIVKQLVYQVLSPLLDGWAYDRLPDRTGARSGRGLFSSLLSSLAGGVIGVATGLGRALLVIAVLFIVTALLPQSQVAAYIQQSSLYQKGAEKVIQPVTGDFLEKKLPVFTRAVEQEFTNILQRKYEVLDARISPDIAEAAKQVTAKGNNDEEKARLLYAWVGTRVQYDWDKVKLYEEKRIWKEQTPEDTFKSRLGVCIDYSRLYAVMARAIGLDVKVVTGLGYDGKGGYGPHAWNEVYLTEQQRWAPLDSTWVSSGGDWFDPPNFNETHIPD